MTTAPLKTFICYAREDRAALESLMGHLAVFQRNGQVQFWYDREITGGKNWDDEQVCPAVEHLPLFGLQISRSNCPAQVVWQASFV